MDSSEKRRVGKGRSWWSRRGNAKLAPARRRRRREGGAGEKEAPARRRCRCEGGAGVKEAPGRRRRRGEGGAGEKEESAGCGGRGVVENREFMEILPFFCQYVSATIS
jgi:hypothetical protein